MALLAVLTGMIVLAVFARITKWYEILVLTSWGILASSTTMGAPYKGMLVSVNTWMTGWFS